MQLTKITRRKFIKTVGAGAIAMAGAKAFSTPKSKRKPNVVLILTDDQGTLDANCYGSKDLYTPNIDKLAQQGVRFSQFYVGAPVCSPSRAVLLTGRYPQRAQLVGNAGYSRPGMPPRQLTIAEMLRPHGYRTAIFGKWHLGIEKEYSPLEQGFDQFFGHKLGCIDNYSHYFYWSGPNRHDLWKNNEQWFEDNGEYFPDLVVREAHRFMEKNKNHHFFMYLPFNIPHYPVQPNEKYRKMYKNLEMPRRLYAALVSTLDEKIGRIVKKIDQLGIREDTIIIFLSDHGHSVEERAFFGGGNAGPFRGHKFTLWEGGIRVPCIISRPGHLPQGQTRKQKATSMDILPTIAHYCGIENPQRKLDGKDISSIINSDQAPSPHDVIHWNYHGHWAVRKGPWKLVTDGPSSNHKGKKIPKTKYFLSNFDEDITETKNLAEHNPEIVKQLAELHNKWIKNASNQ